MGEGSKDGLRNKWMKVEARVSGCFKERDLELR
jgi:hypothetical protein